MASLLRFQSGCLLSGPAQAETPFVHLTERWVPPCEHLSESQQQQAGQGSWGVGPGNQPLGSSAAPDKEADPADTARGTVGESWNS